MIYALILLLILSLVGNGFAIWFIINLLRERIEIIEIFKKFFIIVRDYEQHLATLSKMEIYYGEPTIMKLLEHTKEMTEILAELSESIEVEEKKNDKE